MALEESTGPKGVLGLKLGNLRFVIQNSIRICAAGKSCIDIAPPAARLSYDGSTLGWLVTGFTTAQGANRTLVIDKPLKLKLVFSDKAITYYGARLFFSVIARNVPVLAMIKAYAYSGC